MDLYIIRHAWAMEQDGSRWPDDGQRPLTAAGRKRFALVVKKLVDGGMTPSLIASSPLVRCVETAQLLAEGLANGPQIVELSELRPNSDVSGLLRWTAQQAGKHEQIAWIGHAPDVSYLTASLIGNGDSEIRFAKGAAAAIHFDDKPCLGGGELQWLVSAKVLGC